MLLQTMRKLLVETPEQRLARLAGRETEFYYQPATAFPLGGCSGKGGKKPYLPMPRFLVNSTYWTRSRTETGGSSFSMTITWSPLVSPARYSKKGVPGDWN